MIIDSHVHIFPETLILNRKNFLDKDLTFRTLFSNNNAKMVTAEDLIFNMDKESIDISVILSMGWQDLGIVREVNDYIIDSVKRIFTSNSRREISASFDVVGASLRIATFKLRNFSNRFHSP